MAGGYPLHAGMCVYKRGLCNRAYHKFVTHAWATEPPEWALAKSRIHGWERAKRLRAAETTASQATGLRRGAGTRATLAPKLVPPNCSGTATSSREPQGRGITPVAQSHCRTNQFACTCRPPRHPSTVFVVPQAQSHPDGGAQARTAEALAAGRAAVSPCAARRWH